MQEVNVCNQNKYIFGERWSRYEQELKDYYMDLYHNEEMFVELRKEMERWYEQRNPELKKMDMEKEADPNWYKSNDMLGMMFYIDNFAGNMKNIQNRLSYIEKCNVSYIHLMPFLDTVEGRSDGGYAVADFRKVKEEFGTMEDLEQLTHACHEKKINVCMDFVMNHTSQDHE